MVMLGAPYFVTCHTVCVWKSRVFNINYVTPQSICGVLKRRSGIIVDRTHTLTYHHPSGTLETCEFISIARSEYSRDVVSYPTS